MADENGIIHNKDNSLQLTFTYRPPDLESATQDELVINTARLNNILKRLGTGWVVFMEAQRRKSDSYISARFPHAITNVMEQERQEYFNNGEHFESYYYFTLLFDPPSALQKKMTSFFFNDSNGKPVDEQLEEKINDFLQQAELIFGLLEEFFPDCRVLTPEETLTYLHSTISDRYYTVKIPDPSMYLDSYLYDCDFSGQLAPIIGESHCRIVTILSYTPTTSPGFLDSLNSLGFEYRWVSRFIFLDKLHADKELKQYQAEWGQQAKTLWQRVTEAITKQATSQIDETAILKKEEVTVALQELNTDCVGYGYYSMSVIVLDKNEEQANKKAAQVLKTINSLGVVAKLETLNAVEAWYGSLPGVFRANIRRNLVNTLNFCHMSPVSDIWPGDKMNKHLNGPTLLYTDAMGDIPFRLSLHVDDVAHTMVIGPTGSGKSVLLNTLEAHFTKYPNSRMYIFDKGASSRALTYALGGNFYNLGIEGNELSFQPLAKIDDEQERAWVSEWLCDFLRLENPSNLTSREKTLITEALTTLAEMPAKDRDMSTFVNILQDFELRQAFTPLTKEGSYGKLFDANKDRLGSGRWQVFEMEALMNNKRIIPSTLDYLFHRIEGQLKEDGAPSMIVLDECWLYLDNIIFAKKIREYFKDMRKKNTGIVFATQNLTDITESEICSTIINNCPTQIFLPNPKATNEQNTKLYHLFGLNDQQIQLIAHAIPKRQYYYSSTKGNRLFELNLRPMERAFVTATGKEDQLLIDQILREYPQEEFAYRWLEFKGLQAEIEKAIAVDI